MHVRPLGMYYLADSRFVKATCMMLLLLRISQLRKLQREQFIMLLLLLLSLAIRVYHLGFSELIGDEGFSYLLTRNSYAEIAAQVVAMGEPHPLGSYFVFKAWSDIAGTSEFALRFPSAWFGVLAVGLVYRLGRELRLSSMACIAAAVLMALSPFGVLFSREMRMYGMLLALTTASTLLTWMLFRRFSWRTTAAYAFVSWLALNTHYYAGFVLVAHNLFIFGSVLLLRINHQLRLLLGWFLAQAGIFIGSLPWLVASLNLTNTFGGIIFDRSPDPISALSIFLGSFIGGQYFPTTGHLSNLIWLCFVLIIIGLTKLWQGDFAQRSAGLLLLVCLIVPLLLTWVGGLSWAAFSPRYAITTLGPLHLILANATWGWFEHRRSARTFALGRSALAIAGLIILAATLVGLQGYLRSDRADGDLHTWRRFIDVINRHSSALPTSSVRVALNFPDPVFVYYHHRYLPPDIGFTTLPPMRPRDAEGTLTAVREWRDQGAERVLLQVVDSFWDGQGVAADALAREFTYIGETYTGRWNVKIYGRPGPSDLQLLNTRFVNGTLLTAAYARVDLPARLVEVYFSWDHSEATLRGSEKFFIHVSKREDPFAVIGQRDEPLASNLPQAIYVDKQTVYGYGVRLKDVPPPGEYLVRIGLYRPDEPGMPRVLTSDGRDFIALASFSIE